MDLFKSYIIKEFKDSGIPSGYHDLNVTSDGIITLKALHDQYNYIKGLDLTKFISDIELLLNQVVKILKYDTGKIEFKVSPAETLIKSEFKWVHMDQIKELNQVKLYHQLNNHLLHDVTDIQVIFDLLCSKDKEFYNNIFLQNWNIQQKENNLILDYSSDLIISMLIPQVKVKYENLLLTEDINLINLLLNNLTLSNPSLNYLLLHVIKLKNMDLIKRVLGLGIELNDQGNLLTEVISKYWSEELFLLLIQDTRIKVNDDVMYKSIDNNNIYVILYLLKHRKIMVNQDHLIYAKNKNKIKVYNILLDPYKV